MLTGKSGFHISTPLGFEPGSLVTGSKRVVHWTSEIAGLHRAPPQQPTPSVVKLERGTAASMKSGQKSYVIKLIKSAYTLLA
jgi:hypothetical protein